MPDADPLVVLARPGADATCAAVYLGFGLASRGGLSVGRLPLDALAMVLVAEGRRRLHGAERVVHLIADRHALVNGFATRREVAHAADSVFDELQGLAAALRLPGYEVLRASSLRDEDHRRLVAAAGERWPEPYAVRQAADVEWMRRRRGVGVKVGWTLRASGAAPSFDEQGFDEVHRAVFGPGLTTVYTGPGRTLDPARPRCSPYVLLEGQDRLTLASGYDDIRRQCASARMRRHLRPICDRALEHLGVATDADLPERLELLLAALAGHLNPAPAELALTA